MSKLAKARSTSIASRLLLVFAFAALAGCGGGLPFSSSHENRAANPPVIALEPRATTPSLPTLPPRAIPSSAEACNPASPSNQDALNPFDCARSKIPNADKFLVNMEPYVTDELPIRIIDTGPHGKIIRSIAAAFVPRGAIVPPVVEIDEASFFEGGPGAVVNISQVLLFKTLEMVHTLQAAGSLWTIPTGNFSKNRSPVQGPHKVKAGKTGQVIFVAGSNNTQNTQGSKIHKHSNHCGSLAPWCVVAPFTIHAFDNENNRWAGTSASAPQVAGLLAAYRARWPMVTTKQLVSHVLDNCSDPSDFLNPNETQTEPSSVWGRGKFNASCLFQPLGAVSGNSHIPIPSGSVSFKGASIVVEGIVYDQLGRDFPLLEVVPQNGKSPLHASCNSPSILPVAQRGCSFLGLTLEDNSFFNSRGHGAFKLGDSVSLNLQLAKTIQKSTCTHSFGAASAYGIMRAGGSAILGAHAATFSLFAHTSCRNAHGAAASFALSANSGLYGRLQLSSSRKVRFNHKPQAAVNVLLSYPF